MRSLDLLSTHWKRKLLFAVLYLSEGAPIGYIWWALPTRLRAAGLPIEEITALTSVLTLPWVFKVVWAPLVDTFRSNRWTLRSWILASQFVMGCALIPLLLFDLNSHIALVYPFLILHAFAAATQDVSIDALAIATVPAGERGSINGWMQAGMLAGRGLLGGGGLALAASIGDDVVVSILIGIVWVSALVVFTAVEPEFYRAEIQPRNRLREFVSTARTALHQKSTYWGFLFAGIAGAGFEAVGSVAGPFLIDMDFTSEEVGIFFAVPVIIGMIGGALVGGRVADQYGRKAAVRIFLLLLVLNIVLIAAVELMGCSSKLLIAAMTLFYFSIGLFTASSYALFMDLTDPRLGATQFSAYMGVTNGCEAWATFAVGRLAGGYGYSLSFIVMALISLFALPILKKMNLQPTLEETTTIR